MRKTAFLALLLLTVIGCGGDDELAEHVTRTSTSVGPEESASVPWPTVIGTPVISSTGRPALARGDSIEALVSSADVVVLATITGIAVPYDPRPGYQGLETVEPSAPLTYSTPSTEELGRPPGRLFTVYEARVDQATWGGGGAVAAGTTLFVGQSGGIWEGVEYIREGSSLLEGNRQYLLLLDQDPTVEHLTGGLGYFTGPAFGNFMVEDGRLRPLDEAWLFLPAVDELAGMTPDEAAAAIGRIGATESP